MENEILDSFEDEKPNLTPPLLLHRINSAVGVLAMVIGLCFIYDSYSTYDSQLELGLLCIIYYPNYELLARLCFGVLLLHGGFRIIRKEKLGIETFHVAAIAMITYSSGPIFFDPFHLLESSLYLFFAALLLAFTNWKKLPYLYPNLSLSSYLWLVGIIVGIIPFIFFWEELIS